MPEETLKQMTLGEHLRELRRCILKSVAFWLVIFIICLYLQDELMRYIIKPHYKAVEMLRADGIKVEKKLLSITYIKPFIVYMKLALIASLFFASPYIAYQLWKFVSAGLYRGERKSVLIYAPLSYTLFISGCAFGYFILIPYGLYYLAEIGNPEYIESRFALSEYFDLVMFLTLIMGVVFQLPLIMAFFSKIGVISPKAYIEWWRFAVVAIFLFSAIITPGPDVFSQCAMALPLCFLYGVGILISKAVYPKVK